MTATPPADASYQRLSRLTLALLADTGWCVLLIGADEWQTVLPSLGHGGRAGSAQMDRWMHLGAVSRQRGSRYIQCG